MMPMEPIKIKINHNGQEFVVVLVKTDNEYVVSYGLETRIVAKENIQNILGEIMLHTLTCTGFIKHA
jgi:hypothetical protein